MLYGYGATFPLLNGVSAAPLRLINVVGTAKETPYQKLLRLLAAKFEIEPLIFFSHPIGPLGLQDHNSQFREKLKVAFSPMRHSIFLEIVNCNFA